ncbi:hypothetical protein [Pseudomonas sp. 8Z]|uniref:hypothetical protein n=1 Tax=Pseudomonas sp. 8Z TaxID=2653166 RepID=UPI00135754B9|nr:hypothetical protein [Pseudomonas sp. 8Z]
MPTLLNQPSSIANCRKSLVLSAIFQLNELRNLSQSVPALRDRFPLLALEQNLDVFLDLIHCFAYSAARNSAIVPAIIYETIEQELGELPITIEEVRAVLNTPLGEALSLQV